MPIFMRLVRAAMALAMVSGAASTERSGATCSSASHIASSPHSSAASTSAKPSANAAASLWPGARWNSWNMPNSIGRPLPAGLVRTERRAAPRGWLELRQYRHVVRGPRLAAFGAVGRGDGEALGERGRQQDMVDAEPEIALPRAGLIVPERVDRPVR